MICVPFLSAELVRVGSTILELYPECQTSRPEPLPTRSLFSAVRLALLAHHVHSISCAHHALLVTICSASSCASGSLGMDMDQWMDIISWDQIPPDPES